MYTLIARDEIIIKNKQIKFPCYIMNNPYGNPFIVEMSDLVVVNIYGTGMDKMTDGELEQNIWAFDNDGNLVWKVAAPLYRPHKCNPYTSVYIQEGKLIGGNWAGANYEINITDGKVKYFPENPGRPW